MYELDELKNKTKVIYVPQKDAKSVTVLVMYPVGSRYESKELSGASHFIEHLMFKGTKKRPNTLFLTREIDRLGAEYNAFTSKEYTGYYIKVGKDYANIAFDILADMLYNSLFDPKEMEREKGVIVEEIRMYKDNPLMSIESFFENLLYQNCPLGRDVAGTEKNVMNYEREKVLKYRNNYYQPKNSFVVVAGAVDEKIKNNLEKYFNLPVNLSNSKIGNYKDFIFGNNEKEQRIKVEKKETDQVQMMLGFPCLNYQDERNFPTLVMNTILGGSMSSRLFIQIRERRGLAYMIRSGVENFRDTGYIYVRAGLEAKNINKAIEVIKNEIGKIVSKGITAKELKDAKTHIRGGTELSMEDSSSQASWFASQALFYKKIKTPEEMLDKIDYVTNEEIKKIAEEFFKLNKLRIAIIGNCEKNKIKF